MKQTKGKSTPSKGNDSSTKGPPKSPNRKLRSTAGNKTADPQPASVKDLTNTIKTLKEELEKEKELRNFYQLERDKINSFWEITKNEVAQLQAELRNKDKRMEELEDEHQVEIKVYKQKVKHLHYEHQNKETELKAEEEKNLKALHDEQRNKEAQMKKMSKKIKSEMKELEISHEDVIKNLKQEHDKNITKMRQEFERNVKELHTKYERKMKQLRQDLELRRKNEIHEIEERKNAHINELINKHNQAFAEMKAYYNDSTANNLELIRSLKEQLDELRKKEASDQKLMLEVTMENKRLSEPLQKAMKEVEHLRHELISYSKDKESLIAQKSTVKTLEAEIKSLKWEYEVLEQRFIKVQKERDELYEKFVTSIHEVQQKAGFKNLVLEKKIEALSSSLETREAQLREVIAQANVDPSKIQLVTKKVESILEDKNKMIKDLQHEVAKAKKINSDIMNVYEAKLKEHGVPVEERGFSSSLRSRNSVRFSPGATPLNATAL